MILIEIYCYHTTIDRQEVRKREREKDEKESENTLLQENQYQRNVKWEVSVLFSVPAW